MPVLIHHPDGILDIDPEFVLDVELTNPIYSDRGSMTIPATLPSTLSNRKILGNVHRLDIINAPDKDVRVVVSDGVYRRTGKLNILSAGIKKGITINVGFDEGEMYSLFEDTALSELDWIVEKYTSASLAGNHLEAIMRESLVANYHIFPIQTATEMIDNVKHRELLNQVKFNVGAARWDLVFETRTESSISNGSITNVKVPAGYGCTPFLKVHYILEHIFSYFGYTIVDNPFESDIQLKRMVILNNATDVIVKSKINYAELIPDCTINEFLNSLYVRTGMLYYVDGSKRTVRIKFLKDIIASPAGDEWKEFIATDPKISYAQPKRVVLSAGTTFQDAPPQRDTINKFLAQYNHKFVTDRCIVTSVGLSISAEVTRGEATLFFEIRTGRYFEYDYVSKSLKYKSSDFFPWDLEDDKIEKEELTGKDESVPMSMIAWDDTESLIPLYLAGYRHFHTTLSKGGNEDVEGSTPLAFCFAMPLQNVPYGSIYPYDSVGKKIPDFNMALSFTGEFGCFAQFWQKYDAILRYSNSTIECDLHIPKQKLFSLDLSNSITVEGQRLLIESLNHSLPLSPQNPTKVKLRTLKLLRPYDLSVQKIKTGRPWFKWVLKDGMDAMASQLLREWVNANNYSFAKSRYEIITDGYTEYPSDGDFPLKPPVSINDKIIENHYKLKLKFVAHLIFHGEAFGTYSVSAHPRHTTYWSLDHLIM